MTRIRIGIIGAGQIASLHAKAYAKNDEAEIFAVCDRREDVALKRALDWNATRAYTDYRDLLDDPDVDAVEILTPHHLHHEMALEAAKAGKHIHIAKPLCISLRGVQQVMSAVEEADVQLQVSEPSFFYPPLVEAKAFIDSGEIGQPMSIRMKAVIGSPNGGWEVEPQSWLWRLDPARAGGGPMLFDLGYHKLAAALHLMGPVDKVGCWSARTEIHPGYFLDAPTMLTWRHFGPNQFGSLELSYAPQLYVRSSLYPHLESIEVTGTRGMILINQGMARVFDAAPLQLVRNGRVFSFNELDSDFENAFYASVDHFVNVVLGRSKPRLDGEGAMRALRFTLAAREAGQSGGAVVVGDSPEDLELIK